MEVLFNQLMQLPLIFFFF